MSILVKHLVICAVFAVALLGGRELPLLQQISDAHVHAGVHHDHGNDGIDVADSGYHHDHDDQSDHGDRCCGHVHVHCCAATAILSASTTVIAAIDAGGMRLERNAALAYGQLANPPRRPPRAAA